MQFNLIGPFEVLTDEGHRYAPKAQKICQMLAVLALRPRETVAADTLIRELWGENPPSSALRTLQTHVYHARRMLVDAQVATPERKLLETRAPGYQLDVNDDEVDVWTFERLVRRAQWELDNDAADAASRYLTQAVGLWRGPFLANVPVGSVLTGPTARAEELKIRALELRVEVESRLGRSREFLPELRALVDEYPLHEWFHGRLIVALHQSGRRGEALQAYQNLYHILRGQLGLEPSADLQKIQAEILTAPADDTSWTPHQRSGTGPHSVVPSLGSTAIAG
ncbi:AfsR/SARP family transcriptional regulator [Streptomyces sp. 2A115]|uniref:AfsR/SARP family transcriptional regulator n=1 Tax=Streptomyces sp. 2A115 TaxID=3457439 RepID=UPI003FCF980E